MTAKLFDNIKPPNHFKEGTRDNAIWWMGAIAMYQAILYMGKQPCPYSYEEDKIKMCILHETSCVLNEGYRCRYLEEIRRI